MRIALLCAALGVGSFFFAGCGSNVCDKSDAFAPSSKKGDCAVDVPAKVLGAKSACNDALNSCSDADKKILDGIESCWEALPVCASADQAAWVTQSNGCYASAPNLSDACKQAFFGDVIPGQGTDGGEDAGVDAGPQPDTDGGGALDLFLTADDKTVAMAWVKSQGGVVDHWEVHPFNAADIADPVQTVTPGETLFFQESVGTGEKKRYFVVGFTDAGTVAQGSLEQPDAGEADGGMCNGPLDCAPEFVCNLGSCQTLPCNDPNICPGGYVCDLQTDHRCERIFGFGDGGVDAGTTDAGEVDGTPRPFISESQEISTVPDGGFSSDRVASDFAALNIDVAAVDTARQFIIMEQEGQIFGYFTQNRGKSFSTVSVDPIGTHPHVTYEPASRTMYACYNAFGGIRVRASSDFGKTWKNAALDILNPPPDDGGTATPIQDCALAPWRDGQVEVVAIDGDAVRMWTVKPDLTLAAPDPVTVFSSSATQFAPKEPDIATLPDDFLIHIVFTYTRLTTQGTPDTEIGGYYRDAMTNGFIFKPVHNTNPFPQSQATVTIDPISKRAVAAFVSNEVPAGGGAANDTIYISFWTPSKQWATGSDLNVFARNMTSMAYINVPERQPGEEWVARQPSLSTTRAGRIIMGFSSGKIVSNAPVLQAWAIPFDFNATNKLIPSIKGYYADIAAPVSPTRIARTAAKDTAGPVAVPDQQISTYFGFVEGVGSTGDTANRPVLVSAPK